MRIILVLILVAVLFGGWYFKSHQTQQNIPLPQKKTVKIGILSPANNQRYDTIISSMKEELSKRGYQAQYLQESATDSATYTTLAQKYVDRNVDVIVTNATTATKAAAKATSTTPVIFGSVGDPVANGIVPSLDSSESNVTGVTSLSVELTPKRLDFLKSIKPAISKVYFIYESNDIGNVNAHKLTVAQAQALNITLVEKTVTTTSEFTQLLPTLKAQEADAILGYGTNIVLPNIDKLIAVQNSEKIPLAGVDRSMAESGTIFSYGPEYSATGVQLAALIDQVLKGNQPRFIPIQRPSKLELGINQKVANSIGLSVPQSVISKADFVIQ